MADSVRGPTLLDLSDIAQEKMNECLLQCPILSNHEPPLNKNWAKHTFMQSIAVFWCPSLCFIHVAFVDCFCSLFCFSLHCNVFVCSVMLAIKVVKLDEYIHSLEDTGCPVSERLYESTSLFQPLAKSILTFSVLPLSNLNVSSFQSW